MLVRPRVDAPVVLSVVLSVCAAENMMRPNPLEPVPWGEMNECNHKDCSGKGACTYDYSRSKLWTVRPRCENDCARSLSF